MKGYSWLKFEAIVLNKLNNNTGCGRQNNGPTKMSKYYSQKPVNMLPYVEEGTLRWGH